MFFLLTQNENNWLRRKTLPYKNFFQDDDAYLLKGEQPNPGPEMDTVYIPGTPGAAWTKEEVESTRLYFIL